jgi:hypothetical protein
VPIYSPGECHAADAVQLKDIVAETPPDANYPPTDIVKPRRRCRVEYYYIGIAVVLGAALLAVLVYFAGMTAHKLVPGLA